MEVEVRVVVEVVEVVVEEEEVVVVEEEEEANTKGCVMIPRLLSCSG